MLSKIAQILSITLVLCFSAQASEGRFTLLPKGGKAPFEATCFDDTATAKILTWKEFSAPELDWECAYEQERLRLDYNLIIENLEITLEETRIRYQIETDTRDTEIEKLREIVKKNKKINLPVVIASSLGAGIGIGFGAYHIARR